MTEVYELGSAPARELLAAALKAAPPRLDWVAAAVARLEFEGLEPAEVEAPLDSLAERVRTASQAAHNPFERLQRLSRVLADEEGFRGNEEDYHAPENSYLNLVLERKVGLPISLCVVYIEVARRVDLPLFGVSFPGHFVAALEGTDGMRVLDPFNGGRILTEAGCEDLLGRIAPKVKFTPQMLTPAPVKSIAYRMLNNLKRVHLDRGDGERALKVVDLMLAVAPDHPGELRARATILSALGAYRAALADIERCLALSPASPDHQTLLDTASALRQRVDHLN